MMVQAPGMTHGLAQCYKEECPNTGVYVCRAMLCCKDYGCGKLLCDQHRSRKCIARHGKNGPP